MRTLTLIHLIVGLIATVLATGILAQADVPAGYVVIVNPQNATSSLERSFLEDAFLKKVTAWRPGAPIRPVDLAPHSHIRRHFTHGVLRRSVPAVRNYWQQRIFAGHNLPPPELDTDEEVVKYVLSHEGALGYVSVNANLKGARVVAPR